jgi:hypothetical protein
MRGIEQSFGRKRDDGDNENEQCGRKITPLHTHMCSDPASFFLRRKIMNTITREPNKLRKESA